MGNRARKILRMTDGMKLVIKPLMTGRLATVLKPGVLSSLLTCRNISKASSKASSKVSSKVSSKASRSVKLHQDPNLGQTGLLHL